ncbi:MFS transporter [Actinoplanes awajinensis]|uniref:MFS transporter n=1 Tax=Actinoplanes awajinensis subsp. mycoplanecinus TaxID=135947 RepID=A0A101JI52_9ACTN|nr:MFS transporter [Actinoplanes awajinensis]KUL27293.1 hypothetical protein ADL15_35945 [Actinoplanes awajinensis subsp. mycoplanecinus]
MDRRPLAIPAFRRLWVASLVSAVGGSFSVVAVPVQLYAMTGSSATVGMAAVVSFVALAGSALGTGALADLRDRRRVLLAAQAGLAVVYAALWVQAVLGGAPLPVVLLLVAGQGLSLGAISTMSGAVLPRLVPADLLPAANSLNSLVRYTGAILGPALAGLLIPVTGLPLLYLCDAAALLAVLRAIHLLPPLPPLPTTAPTADSAVPAASPGADSAVPAASPAADPAAPIAVATADTAAHAASPTDRSAAPPVPPVSPAAVVTVPAPTVGWAVREVAGHLSAGFRRLMRSRVLLAVLAVDLAAMVFGMPVALFPELAERTFGGPSGGGPALGLLYAAYPAGVVLAGLGSAAFTRARRHGLLMAGAAIAWGVTVVLLSLSPWLWAAVVVLVAGGAVNFVLSTFRNAISQAHIEDAVRGRIQGALTVVLLGGPQLANLLHGAAGALIGPRLTIGLGGLLTVLTVTAVLCAVPELRRYPDTVVLCDARAGSLSGRRGV